MGGLNFSAFVGTPSPLPLGSQSYSFYIVTWLAWVVHNIKESCKNRVERSKVTPSKRVHINDRIVEAQAPTSSDQ